MKLTLHSFVADVPPEKICRPGVDYQVYECDAGPDEAFAFFGRLVRPRDSFSLQTPDYSVHFWKHGQALWVEVTGADFWASSEVSPGDARAVIEALHRAEPFGSRIPTTNREWDTHTAPDDKRPVHEASS